MKNTVLISAPRYYGIDTDIQEAFETLGFRALLINQLPLSIVERIPNKIGNKLPFLKPVFNSFLKYFVTRENNKLLAAMYQEKPDLLFVIKGDYIFPENLAKIKKEFSCPAVGYVWDEPFYKAESNQDDYRKYNFKNGIHLYDYIFTFDTFYMDEITKQGAKKVQYLPLATNSTRYKEVPVTVQERLQYDHDVCFIGMPADNRVEIFENLCNYKLGVFGDYWPGYFIRRGLKIPSYYRGKATGETVNKIYLSSKIALNINQAQSKEGLNTRTFDIPACGAFEIVDYKKNVEAHFKIDEEIVTFNNIDELKNKIDYYLKNDELRKSISVRGKQKVLSEHTWVHRVQEVLKTLSI
jgi:spore maturation protein CgeB